MPTPRNIKRSGLVRVKKDMSAHPETYRVCLYTENIIFQQIFSMIINNFARFSDNFFNAQIRSINDNGIIGGF